MQTGLLDKKMNRSHFIKMIGLFVCSAIFSPLRKSLHWLTNKKYPKKLKQAKYYHQADHLVG